MRDQVRVSTIEINNEYVTERVCVCQEKRDDYQHGRHTASVLLVTQAYR